MNLHCPQLSFGAIGRIGSVVGLLIGFALIAAVIAVDGLSSERFAARPSPRLSWVPTAHTVEHDFSRLLGTEGRP